MLNQLKREIVWRDLRPEWLIILCLDCIICHGEIMKYAASDFDAMAMWSIKKTNIDRYLLALSLSAM